MSNREISSLDRFVNARAPLVLGIVSDAFTRRALAAIAGAYAAGGIANLTIALTVAHGHALAPVLAGALFFAGGGVLAGVSVWMKRRLKAHQIADVRLTREAQTLLRSLLTHLEGWPFGRRRRRFRYRRAMRRGLLRSRHDRRCEDVLAPRVFQLLDAAAAQYNRTYAALALDDPARNATLEKLAPNIRAAIDEAMAEILHHAALLDKFPEAGSPLEAQAQGRIAELKDLADQVARLGPSAEAPRALGEGSSRLQDVLGELRADERAREELRLSAAPEETQQLYRAS
jgi:hypothetical protein